MLRELVPVSPKSNYCVCGAWMVLIHVIRLADPIREFLQDKPEETTSHPRRSSTRQSLCAWGGYGDTLGVFVGVPAGVRMGLEIQFPHLRNSEMIKILVQQ